MRNILLLAALLALAPVASAQQDIRIGVGIGVGNSGVVLDTDDGFLAVPASIYLPITISIFRIEPEVGLFRSSVSNDDADAEISTGALQLGTGVFVLRPVGGTNLYLGGRVGITRFTQEQSFGDQSEEESRTNFFVGPALGGEYLFGEHFSLGGEGQLIFTSIGNADEDSDVSASVLSTQAVFFVRWHF